MGGHTNGWILQQKRGMVNWDKISASKGAPQPPPSPPSPSPSPSGPPAAQAPGTPPPLATAATLSEEEARAKLEELLSEPYLAVQRRLEMANLIIGFEQVFMSPSTSAQVESLSLPCSFFCPVSCKSHHMSLHQGCQARHHRLALGPCLKIMHQFHHSGVCVRPCVRTIDFFSAGELTLNSPLRRITTPCSTGTARSWGTWCVAPLVTIRWQARQHHAHQRHTCDTKFRPEPP